MCRETGDRKAKIELKTGAAVTLTTDKQYDGDGDPGPEGVHQDNCELTAVVLMDRRNVASGGGNRVWTLDQGFGKPDATDAATPRLLTSLTLLEPLDTLFVLDR